MDSSGGIKRLILESCKFSADESCGTESFIMNGAEYTDGMTFSADSSTWALYNLNGEFNSFEFTVCHIDDTYSGSEALLQIFCDRIIRKEIKLTPDMPPTVVSLNVSEVYQLKIQVIGWDERTFYGIANSKLH